MDHAISNRFDHIDSNPNFEMAFLASVDIRHAVHCFVAHVALRGTEAEPWTPRSAVREFSQRRSSLRCMGFSSFPQMEAVWATVAKGESDP